MAEQPAELRRINWAEAFNFLRIFKTFRMAIQPGKLALALAGVIAMGIWGGLLDGLWGQNRSPMAGELNAFWQVNDIDAWREAARDERANAVKDIYSTGLLKMRAPKNLATMVVTDETISRIQEDLQALYDEDARKIEGGPKEVAQLAGAYRAAYIQAGELKSRGIFRSFLSYEQKVIDQLLGASRGLLLADGMALTRGFNQVITARHGDALEMHAGNLEGLGILPCVVLMLRGVQWMVMEHFVYAVLFGLGALAIWSLAGGAICRMAAMNIAREEQVSPKSALAFATRKFMGFFAAPLLPVLLILVVGVGLWIGGLIISIPYLGELIAGLTLVLALLGGAVIALVLIGAVGGGSLLWPTVAVEGSDGFDAMSRSYSYFYSRPWRTVIYTLMAGIYAAVAYVIVRYFVLLVLKATRWFLAVGVIGSARPGTGRATADKLHAMWPNPTPENFLPPIIPLGLVHFEYAGAVLIKLWVLLAVLLTCAFLVSFYFSGSTIVYCLLRKKVDATDFEDIYLDEADEAEPVTAGASATSAPATGAAAGGGTSLPVVDSPTPPKGDGENGGT